MATCLAAPRTAPFSAQQQRPSQSRRLSAVRASADGPAVQAAQAVQTISLKLRKPMGLVLAERSGPPVEVFVEEIVAGSNAAKDGRVQVGDVLVGCSAVTLRAGKEGEFEKTGHGARPYENWTKAPFDCRGKQFDTVMAALGSNSERWGFFDVSLEFERKQVEGGEQAAAAAAADTA